MYTPTGVRRVLMPGAMSVLPHRDSGVSRHPGLATDTILDLTQQLLPQANHMRE